MAEGVGDSVRCFYCGVGLSAWKRKDNPWDEHAKLFPSCPQVLLVKGQQFVDSIQRNESRDISNNEAEDAAQSTVLDGIVDTAAAQACIQIGYSRENVIAAINKYINRNGDTIFAGKDQGWIPTHLDKHFVGPELCRILVKTGEESESNGKTEDSESENLHQQQKMITLAIIIAVDHHVGFLPCGHNIKGMKCPTYLQECSVCLSSLAGVVAGRYPSGPRGLLVKSQHYMGNMQRGGTRDISNNEAELPAQPTHHEEMTENQLQQKRIILKIDCTGHHDVVIFPCGHLIGCMRCPTYLTECHVCHTPITGCVVPNYY